MDGFDLEDEGRDLERRIARELGPAPAARPAFRSSLRERFAAAPGARETSGTRGTGASRGDGQGRSRSGPMIEDALRHLSVEPAHPEFRARLREEFLSVGGPVRSTVQGPETSPGSSLGPSLGSVGGAARGPVRGGAGPRPRGEARDDSGPRRARRRAGAPREVSSGPFSGPFSWQVGVGLLAAAAAVLVIAVAAAAIGVMILGPPLWRLLE